MLTAHLPSGYLAARTFAPTLTCAVPVGLIASILPDFDLIWFYLIDNRAFHHHHYWVHVPAFWAVLALLTWPLANRFNRLGLRAVFFGVIALHMVLDTIAGGIAWGRPFTGHLFTLVGVPATQSHWLLNFVLHWTFLLELVIWALAVLVFMKGRRP